LMAIALICLKVGGKERSDQLSAAQLSKNKEA